MRSSLRFRFVLLRCLRLRLPWLGGRVARSRFGVAHPRRSLFILFLVFASLIFSVVGRLNLQEILRGLRSLPAFLLYR